MYKVSFCPNPKCKKHNKSNENKSFFIKIGYYKTKTFGYVQRYKCKLCNRSFSDQTFKLDYYAKKILNYKILFHFLISKSGIRSISRFFEVSTETIQNRISRLARQSLVFHENCKSTIRLNEDLTAFGFGSFSVSQYFPNNINILAGKHSQYIYFSDYITIRRKGKMSDKQKKKREKVEKIFRADPEGIKQSFTKLLEDIVNLEKDKRADSIILFTDKKKDYVYSVKKSNDIQKLIKRRILSHVCISSKDVRSFYNDLFSVNYIDREYRKGLANHVRETIEFTRNVNDGMNRIAIYNVNHNYFKRYRIKDIKSNISHGEVAGVSKDLIEKCKKSFFKIRSFISLESLNDVSRKLWYRKYVTPLKSSNEYIPKYIT